MNATRLELVTKAFQKLVPNEDNEITIACIRNLFDSSKHPKFLSGEWNDDKCFFEFLNSFIPMEAPSDSILSGLRVRTLQGKYLNL